MRNRVDLMDCLLEEKDRRNKEKRSVITFESTKIPQIKNHFFITPN